MKPKYGYVLSFLLLLASCSAQDSKDKQANIDPNLIGSPISLRITSQMKTEQIFRRTTIVPNLTASWLSQMILIDNSGRLYQSSANQPSAKPLSQQQYADVLGMVRENKAGVFLGIDNNGSLKAFFESNDDADYEQGVSTGPESTLSAFCQDGRRSETRLSGSGAIIDNKGHIRTFKSVIDDDKAVSLELQDNPTFESYKAIQCAYTPSGDLVVLSKQEGKKRFFTISETGEAKTHSETLLDSFTVVPMPDDNYVILGIDADNSELYLQTQQSYHPVTIENGLSYLGAEKIQMIMATDINMGSTFGQGIIVLQEPNGERLIFISLSYAQDVLKGYGAP